MNNINHDNPLPPLRRDLDFSHVKRAGTDYVVISDPLGVVENTVALSENFFQLLFTLDGKISLNDIKVMVRTHQQAADEDFTKLFSGIDRIKKIGLLESEEFFIMKKKLEEKIAADPRRPMLCAGSSYEEDPDKFIEQMQEFFATVGKIDQPGNANAIIVPHIDFRIGEIAAKTYAAGYRAIQDTNADTFIIFGTSHKVSSDYFMLSEKDYMTPLGPIETDRDFINDLKEKLSYEPKIDEIAHRLEHSVEFQAVLLKYFFRNRDIKIVPILVGSFYEHIISGTLPETNPKIKEFMEVISAVASEKERKTIFISSVDFSHIGKKFGDDFNAETMLEMIYEEDSILIDSLIAGDKDSFFEKISKVEDKWKVCGTAPIYSMLGAAGNKEGRLLQYSQWNERETFSAVTFAGIAYYDNMSK
ncbi:MAG: AmmeMemoRadiSam system protein B [Candidatus Kapaibacterium sp.]